jgi:rare lipoprotein A
MRRPRVVSTFFWVSTAAFSSGALAEQRATGIASYYTAVPPSSDNFTAAHRHLHFGTRVRVTRADTGQQVIVRINDRGPFIKDRIIDLSFRAAKDLGIIDAGLAE